jgi:hypothetical protein
MLRAERAFGGGLFAALVITQRAGAEVAQVNKIIVAGVAIGPTDVYTRARGDVNFDAMRLSTRVDGYGHGVRDLEWLLYAIRKMFQRSVKRQQSAASSE